jgi:hypothetical protein
MKKIIFLYLILFSGLSVKAQAKLNSTSDVINFMENKTYYNSELNISLEFEYVSNYNTYGIILKSIRSGQKNYYINCDINSYGSFADVAGISPNDGSDFKFRLYTNRIVVGIGERKQYTLLPQ